MAAGVRRAERPTLGTDRNGQRAAGSRAIVGRLYRPVHRLPTVPRASGQVEGAFWRYRVRQSVGRLPAALTTALVGVGQRVVAGETARAYGALGGHCGKSSHRTVVRRHFGRVSWMANSLLVDGVLRAWGPPIVPVRSARYVTAEHGSATCTPRRSATSSSAVLIYILQVDCRIDDLCSFRIYDGVAFAVCGRYRFHPHGIRPCTGRICRSVRVAAALSALLADRVSPRAMILCGLSIFSVGVTIFWRCRRCRGRGNFLGWSRPTDEPCMVHGIPERATGSLREGGFNLDALRMTCNDRHQRCSCAPSAHRYRQPRHCAGGMYGPRCSFGEPWFVRLASVPALDRWRQRIGWHRRRRVHASPWTGHKGIRR